MQLHEILLQAAVRIDSDARTPPSRHWEFSCNAIEFSSRTHWGCSPLRDKAVAFYNSLAPRYMAAEFRDLENAQCFQPGHFGFASNWDIEAMREHRVMMLLLAAEVAKDECQ